MARGISLDEVEHALEGANLNASGGFVVQGPMEWMVRAVGRAKTLDDLRGTVVALRGGTPVLLGDVSDVREAPAIRRGMAHRLEGEVVSCRVIKQFGADTMKVADGVRRAIAEVQESLPPGVHLRIVYDQSELVSSSLGGVSRAILIGAFLVVLVLFGLLGDIRAAAIIVTENIVHRLRAGSDKAARKALALKAAREVGRPITFERPDEQCPSCEVGLCLDTSSLKARVLGG